MKSAFAISREYRVEKRLKMNTNQFSVSLFGVFVLGASVCGCDSKPSGRSSGSTYENSGESSVQGSQELKEATLRGLTQEEKALRNYEDEMILKGETESNSHYEELQRKAQESR
jgi:hypothetical protein